MEKESVLFFLFVIGIILFHVQIVNAIGYHMSAYIFDNYEYDLQDLIEKSNLTQQEQLWGHCFDTNEEIKELAGNLATVYDVQRWISAFPYDKDRNSIHCQKATETLRKGKGKCGDISILACSIFEEKGIPCYDIGGEKGWHGISLVYYKDAWRPVLSTGYITVFNIDEFMDSLFLIWNKEERYFRNP